MGSCSQLTQSRRWEGDRGGGQITVLQWNILAQTLAINGDFPCQPEALVMDHRFSRIIQVKYGMKFRIGNLDITRNIYVLGNCKF